jgi:hypothetical protein
MRRYLKLNQNVEQTMRAAELVNFTYFLLMTIFALFWPMPSRSKIRAVVIGVVGIAVARLAAIVPGIFRDLLPVPLMAVAYWQSGCFFHKPNPRLQEIFEDSERTILRILRADLRRWSQTWIGTALELAYVLCYPVVPLGLAALYLAGLGNRVDDYWLVVLLSAYPAMRSFLSFNCCRRASSNGTPAHSPN